MAERGRAPRGCTVELAPDIVTGPPAGAPGNVTAEPDGAACGAVASEPNEPEAAAGTSPVQACAKVRANSAAVWNRPSGRRASARENHASSAAGSSASIERAAGNDALQIARVRAAIVSPENGGRPVTAS